MALLIVMFTITSCSEDSKVDEQVVFTSVNPSQTKA